MRSKIELTDEFDRQLATALAIARSKEAFDELDIWFEMPLSRLKNSSWRCRRRPEWVTRHILAYLAAQPDLVCDAQGWWRLRRASVG